MNKLESEIKGLQFLLKNIYSDLSSISMDSFSERIPKIRNKMEMVVYKRKELLLKFDKSELKKYDEKLFSLSKLIQKKFDNIIEHYKGKKLEIAKKLLQIDNQKKLANYIR